MYSRYLYIVLICFAFFTCSCSGDKPKVEPLPISVKNNFNLLQKDPQFVLYVNFKSMNQTPFWKANISDSLLNAERTFGSLLNTFKVATGASISDGLDELYYSNSWMGENSIVLKGVFDRKKLNDYLATDSNFVKTTGKDGTLVYMNNDNRLYFFFKDNFTICASNYMTIIDGMISVRDTSKTGLMENNEMLSAIEKIYYKENLWMISKEQMFIRGIFMNFLESKLEASENNQNKKADSTKTTIENIYSKISSVSFSVKMDSQLNLYVQTDFTEGASASYFKSFLTGLLSISKLASTVKGNQKSPADKILESTKLELYDSTVMIIMNVNNSNISDFRKGAIINKPE
ncbi:MAG: hypothetical protein JSS63_12610 [Bacteroidetes bacterium]|nr:hypothetical protein [Bacteroidota bacterium]